MFYMERTVECIAPEQSDGMDDINKINPKHQHNHMLFGMLHFFDFHKSQKKKWKKNSFEKIFVIINLFSNMALNMINFSFVLWQRISIWFYIMYINYIFNATLTYNLNCYIYVYKFKMVLELKYRIQPICVFKCVCFFKVNHNNFW